MGGRKATETQPRIPGVETPGQDRPYATGPNAGPRRKGEQHGSLAGEGEGRIPEVIADAVRRGYDGFAVMEPHLLGGGPTGGVTGAELFPKAVAAFRDILDKAGAKHD